MVPELQVSGEAGKRDCCCPKATSVRFEFHLEPSSVCFKDSNGFVFVPFEGRDLRRVAVIIDLCQNLSCIAVSLISRLAIPPDCFRVVPLDTFSGVIADPQAILCRRESLFSRFPIPLDCLRVVWRE